MFLYLFHRSHEAGVSEVQVSGYGVIPVLFYCTGHDLIEGRVDDIEFGGAGNINVVLVNSEDREKIFGLLLLEFLRHFTW